MDQYSGRIFSDLCSKYKVKHRFSNSYNPQGNSISERINQCIGTNTRIGKGGSLEDVVKKIENNLNSSYHRVLKCSPEEIIFGTSSIDPLKKSAEIDLNIIKRRIEEAG